MQESKKYNQSFYLNRLRQAHELANKPNDTSYWSQFKNTSFVEFNHLIGLPLKHEIPTDIFQYEIDLLHALEGGKHFWIKKATGLGITEITLRWIAWMCCKDDNFKTNHVDVDCIIITGPRFELAIQLMERLRNLFKDKIFEDRRNIAMLNGAKIEAFPSHNLATARGLSPRIVFLDEADFFPNTQQEEARMVSERYIIKTNPHIIMVSTPNLPGGLFERMEKEEPSIYTKIQLPYTVGVRDGMFTEAEILEGRKSPSFEREYNLKYGVGIGNIFPYQLVDNITKQYDLTLGQGQKLITVDPAYGSSKFAIIGWEKADGIIYIKEAEQFKRPSPSAMLDRLVMMGERYDNALILVDSAHPGLIRDLQDKGCNVHAVQFGSKVDNKQSLISKMTIEASQAVKEMRVMIHPAYHDLLSQLKAVSFNDKGHPDKTLLNFDLGDCFLMGCNHLKTVSVSIIKG